MDQQPAIETEKTGRCSIEALKNGNSFSISIKDSNGRKKRYFYVIMNTESQAIEMDAFSN